MYVDTWWLKHEVTQIKSIAHHSVYLHTTQSICTPQEATNYHLELMLYSYCVYVDLDVWSNNKLISTTFHAGYNE